MKCHILFSEKNKKNISKCRLLKILPRVLSVNVLYILQAVMILFFKRYSGTATDDSTLSYGEIKHLSCDKR